jgi:hypothetical protein
MTEEKIVVTEEKKDKVIVAGEAMEYEEVRKKVLECRDKSEQNYWEFGTYLEEVYRGDLYRSWGFDSWTSYVKEELDFDIRTIQYLVKLQKWFGTVSPKVQKWARSIGWTKARMLMHVVNDANATEWKNRVSGKTVAQIAEMLDAEKNKLESGEGDGEGGGEGDGEGGEVPERARKRSFSLFPSQDETVTSALEKAKEIAQSDKEGHLITLICTEFLANNTATMTRDDLLKSIEKNIGVKIIAMVPSESEDKQDDIVYGYDYLNPAPSDE